MLSLKNTASIFLEIFLIECCTVLVKQPMTSSLSKTKKDILKRKSPSFYTLKGLSNKQQLFFYFTSWSPKGGSWSHAFHAYTCETGDEKATLLAIRDRMRCFARKLFGKNRALCVHLTYKDVDRFRKGRSPNYTA